ARYDDEIAELAVPTADGGIRASGLSTAYEGRPTREYDADCDCVVESESGRQWFADNDNGRFVDSDGKALAQGWQVGVGASNFTRVITDPDIRGPFLAVLGWDLLFATSSVLLTFALGLACAVTL